MKLGLAAYVTIKRKTATQEEYLICYAFLYEEVVRNCYV